MQLDLPMREFVKYSPEKIASLGLRSLTLATPVLSQKTDTAEGEIGLRNYSFSYEKEDTLHMKDTNLPPMPLSPVTGHNGAGKSTFCDVCRTGEKIQGENHSPGREKNLGDC